MVSKLSSLLLCSLLPLVAQNKRNTDEPTTMLVHGEAAVSMEPDIAELDIGVSSQGQTSQAATDQNTAKSRELSAQLQRLVNPADIKSVNFAVNPNYRYPKDGGATTITGYTANTALRITVRDLSQLRSVIEAATHVGASSIDRLAFDLKDEKAARALALARAADQARSGAEALAASLHLRLGKLIRIEEVQPVVISPAREVEVSALKEPMADPSVLAPGAIQIHTSVNLIYAAFEK